MLFKTDLEKCARTFAQTNVFKFPLNKKKVDLRKSVNLNRTAASLENIFFLKLWCN